ncbi:PREDICTED: BTB/POZ domain-containing protein 19-like isoform X2 [Priapulus caudatus]|uniref:BTB/POZ domain-containing protein 19-like isoform X2 n=1 Tax=Priapulus caudatus TaxID=37621 RepID=A0ABM1DNZ7_PRICU|nr:PREDICTED: BTB/POZ domain-containing protein 19-like isoform X2 [Priapulus caudatus]
MMSRGPLAPPPPPPPKTHMLSHKPQMEEKNIVGVPALLDDLYKLSHDQTTADMLFIVGPEEERFYCHKLILYARCSTFQAYKDEFFYTPKSHPYQQSYRFFRPEHFKSVLMYIYTGRLVLNYDNVVDILSIAQHLGLDDLQKNCEDFVARQLNLDNACLFLAAAMRMGQQFQGSSDNSFVERCAEYIEENAEECIHTESFLRLPKEALIRLVSSDQLALEENDVWRAVLAWAKQQTGINKPVSTWSEAEKGRVRVQMSGVIEHVKLLLIDSTVFAEEVEPTGAVPMEMSLERYRFAAVPDKVGDPHDKKLRPRLCVKLFHDTEILVRDRLQYQKQLSIWYGESKQAWKLIYRASRDGFSAQSFHTHCDGYCPTFIIVLGIPVHVGQQSGCSSHQIWHRQQEVCYIPSS